MRGYRNSNGGVVRLASGGLQSSATGKPCCCGANCANGTGCSGAHTLCTGMRFVLPAITANSVSGGQSGSEMDDDAVAGHPYEYWRTDGTIAGNVGGLHSSWAAIPKPPVAGSYTASGSTVTLDAFRSPLSNSSITGFSFSASINGNTTSFDGMSGVGASLSVSISPQSMAEGTLAVGPEVSGTTLKTTTTIDDYGATETVNTIASYETKYAITDRDYDGAFSYGLTFYVGRTEWYEVVLVTSKTTSIRYEKTSSPTYDYTVTTEEVEVTRAIRRRSVIAWGTSGGTSSVVGTACEGGSGSVTVVDADLVPSDHAAMLEPFDFSGSSGTGEVIAPVHGGVFGFEPTPTTDPMGWQSGTAPEGSVTMALDTTDFTEAEVGCRDCPRYLTFSGTISHYNSGNTTVPISGRIVMQGVDECGWYHCDWSSTYGTAGECVIELPGGDISGTVYLTRIGPSLYLFTIIGDGGGFVFKFFLKFSGDCPTGSATICQAPLGWTATSSVNRVLSKHTYGEVAEYDSGTNTYINSPIDEWFAGTDYVDHTATTSDLDSLTIEPIGYDGFYSANSLTFTATTREAGDPDYYCSSGYTMWDTGEEVNGSSEDQHWEKKIDSGSYFAPIVETTNPFLTYYYNGTNTLPGKWIGTDADGTGSVGVHTYKTTINASKTPEVDIGGYISADNYVTGLVVNGVVIATNLTPNDTTSHEQEFYFEIPASALGVGDNEVLIIKEDQGEREGFRLRWVRP